MLIFIAIWSGCCRLTLAGLIIETNGTAVTTTSPMH